jgi:hypothetical protein
VNPFARVPSVKLGREIIEPSTEGEAESLQRSRDRGRPARSRNYALFGEALRCVVFEEAILSPAAGFDEPIRRAGDEELLTLE